MKLLLDAHTFLWFIDGSSNLNPAMRTLIEDTSNRVLVSIASIGELAIKVSINKINLGQPFESLILQQISLNIMELLPIELNHITAVTTLPFHHRDPFDRMLIAQAMFEQIPIVSADKIFDVYPVTRLW